ncbi:MAG: hypothetical protein KGJ80_20990, partial [Chloroflexota bacterium]|nr:hypothetical protein [Chloroflexota bacterium]
RTVSEERREYYSDFLERILFETLSRRRADDESPWGKIPYLNGGLFEKDYDYTIRLPNRLFDPQASSTILGFFNSYNFTVEEDTPLVQQAALSPEIVGRAFEDLLAQETAGETGGVIAPQPIVRFMCREALLGYLQDTVQMDRARLHALFDEELGPLLEKEEADALASALRDVRVLDPAVGAGAFLVEMLHDLITLRRACQRAAGEPGSMLHAAISEWKREFIANCLYGVDTRREAIEITKWRLWLSLAADAERDQLEPLPNLDYQLLRGNLLIETLGGQSIFAAPADEIPSAGKRPTVQLTLGISETERAMAALRALKDRFTEAEPIERIDLQKQIQQQETEIVLTYLGERQAALEQRMKALLRRGRQVQWKGMPHEKNRLTILQDSLARLGALREQIHQGAVLPFFLSYLHFGEVMKGKGGFDIMLGNPPSKPSEWNDEQKLALQNEYPRVYHPHADSPVYFFARGL